VLRTGLDAKAWGAPGIAQQLLATLPRGALSHFGVRSLPGATDGVHWGGGPTTLLVSDDAPHAISLARALEPLLSSPGNEVRTSALPRAAWLEARRSRRFALLLDFVRSATSDPAQATQALLAAVDPALAKHPPQNLASLPDLTRTLSLGVVGELCVSGSRMPAFEGLEAWQLDRVWFNEEKQ
jgi:hypothetical protein